LPNRPNVYENERECLQHYVTHLNYVTQLNQLGDRKDAWGGRPKQDKVLGVSRQACQMSNVKRVRPSE